MQIEILSIGDELVTGAIVDTNSAYIAEQCLLAGFEVTRHTCAPDHLPTLRNILIEMGNRADIAIVSGGLGPTLDDLTRQAAAEAAGEALALNDEALDEIKRYFDKIDHEMPQTNQRQAHFPKGAHYLSNPIGTAPGFWMRINKCHFYFVPGVPREMKRMLHEKVFPLIEKTFGQKGLKMHVKTLFTFGLTEALLGEYLEEIEKHYPEIKFGTKAHFPGIEIKLYTRGDKAEDILKRVHQEIEESLGKSVFISENATLGKVVSSHLKENGATLSILEIGQGKILGHLMLDLPEGTQFAANMSQEMAESYLQEVFSLNEPKSYKKCALKLKEATCSTYGMVLHGNTAGEDGTVHVAIANDEGTSCYSYTFKLGGPTLKRQFFAMLAVDLVRRKLQKTATLFELADQAIIEH